MKSFLFLLFTTFFIVKSQAAPLWMRYPSISPDGQKIVFSYQGDIFIVPTTGGNAIQLSSHPAHDYMPVWSADGEKIAFASNRYGNFDVFVMSKNGGTPSRLTYKSSNDYPYDFSPNDESVIFGSVRLDNPHSVQFPYARLGELYEVNVTGQEIPRQILTIAAEDAKYSKDGKQLIFHNKKGYEDPWRKHHTSSVTRDIVLYDLESKKYSYLTQWKGEDRNPILNSDGSFYFLSEKSGSFNVWKGTKTNAYDTQITDFKVHPVRFLSQSDNGILCFSFDGEIFTLQNGKPQKISINIYKDPSQNESFPLNIMGGISEFDVSPSGKEIAFIYRGEVFVTSADYSTTKRITYTSEQERSVQFSPDGKRLVYAGERNESWNLYTAQIERDEETYFFNATLINEETLVDNGEETFQAEFSPNGEEVAFLENRTTLKVINLASKKERVVMNGDYNYSYSDGDQYFTWAPDSKYLLVEFFDNKRWSSDIGLVNANGKEAPINLTHSGYANGRAKFAMDGEMVYYSTNKYGYRSHGSWGAYSDVEAVFLTKKAYAKFTMNEEEYELWKEDEKAMKKDTDKEDKPEKSEKKAEEKEVKPIVVETEGLDDRKIRLSIHSSTLSNFLVNNEGTEMYYLAAFEKGFDLWKTDFKKNETKLVYKIGSWSGHLEFNDKEDHLYFSKKGMIQNLDLKTQKPEMVKIKAEMSINENAERTYMFNHAWRQVREKFYVEDLHGVDWELMKKDYSKFLPHINNGFDFEELLSEMLGELNASHTGARYRYSDKKGDQTASLACFYDETYTKKGIKIAEILDKSPLTLHSDKMVAGVVIEKIDGHEIDAKENFYPYLNRKAGKKVLLSMYNPNTGERWEEVVKPISRSEEYHLLYERWVKICEKTVDEQSNGQLGYVHVQGMNSASFREVFDRALGMLNTKKALIVDTRFNGGGWLHDDLATFLSGKMYMQFEPRGQKNMGGEPIWKWQKPSCVLMSEGNYSDAHLFPYTYKALNIGKLIGMPVPGTGTAVWWETMVDGQTVFGIPQIGMRSVSEGYLVENHELQPDIQVNNEYEQFTQGVDQQLEAAIKEMMKE